MSKLYNYYDNNIDYAWYDSSTVLYSECIDNDNALKTLHVFFKNGRHYCYKNINVNDYLMFRESVSTGKGLNKFIKEKGYEFEKLDNADVDKIKDEYEFRTGKSVMIESSDGGLTLYNSDGDELGSFDPYSYEDAIAWALQTVGYRVRNKNTNENINPKERNNKQNEKEN